MNLFCKCGHPHNIIDLLNTIGPSFTIEIIYYYKYTQRKNLTNSNCLRMLLWTGMFRRDFLGSLPCLALAQLLEIAYGLEASKARRD